MIRSRRLFALIIVPIALAAIWMFYGPNDKSQLADAQQAAQPAAGGEQNMQANLDQAATSIAAAAQQGLGAARSGDQMLERVDLSVESLRILTQLGSRNADSLAVKLLDDAQAQAPPPVAEVLVRMRLARQVQQWSQLTPQARQKAIARFVSDVEKSSMTPRHAELVMRLVDNLEMQDQRDLAGQLVNGLLPAFRTSTEPSIQRRTPLMEGIAHRLGLVGKPLEMEGTLLDGSQLDWESYRGKVVLVDFFANWCGVCREEVPIVLEAFRAFHDKGFEVVGVSLDKSPALAANYQRETGFNFPTLFSSDPQAMEWKNPLAIKYGVTSLPRAILVDQHGNVVETVARGPRLIQHLQELLGPPTNGLGQLENVLRESGEDEGEAPGAESSGVVPASFEQPAAGGEDAAAAPAPEK